MSAVQPVPAVPPVHRLASPADPNRAWLEAHLCAQRFASFFRAAWPHMDPAHLLWSWHVDLLCLEMERVARRKHREAVFCIPPRSLKSQILSVAFPAWVWTWFPAAKFITASNELTLATRDAVKMRRLVNSEWYQLRWGPKSPYLPEGHPGVAIVSDQGQKTYYETIAGGHRFCCTPGSNVTGHGCDFVLCDDPHPANKAESEADRERVLTWWNEAIPSRLNDPNTGVKLVIQQRVHRADLAGACIAKGYYRVVLPMEFDPDHPDKHPKDKRTKQGELLHPARINTEALSRLKRAMGPYACTPHESPVLMSDLSMKPIGEVKIGDEVVGFGFRALGKDASYQRLMLQKAKVVNVHRYHAPVVRMTLDSGEVIRCTPDHKWFRKVRPDRSWYGPVEVGGRVARVCPPRLPELSREDERLAGWLSGFFDGEGSVSLCKKHDNRYKPSPKIMFYQGSGRNAPLCEKLEAALTRFGFDFSFSEDERKTNKDAPCYGYRSYALRGDCLPLMQRFLSIVQPVKWRDRIADGAYGSKFITGRERVISVEPDGEEDVFALETSTGNYVVWGLASSNSAGQLQQRPVPREGGLFQERWFTVVDAIPHDAAHNRVRRWDLAATVATGTNDPDWTCGVLVSRDSTGRVFIENATRFRDTPAKVDQAIKAQASIDGRGTTIVIPQDPGAAGKSVAEHLVRFLAPYTVRVARESGSKVERARSLSAQAEMGNVFLLRGDWNQWFIEEFCDFPNGAHDDAVDAATGAFDELFNGNDGMIAYYRALTFGEQPPVPDSAEVYGGMRVEQFPI